MDKTSEIGTCNLELTRCLSRGECIFAFLEQTVAVIFGQSFYALFVIGHDMVGLALGDQNVIRSSMDLVKKA